jgi:hypothetical protein
MKKLTGLALFAGAALLCAQSGAPNAAGPKTFGSPEEARDALVQAATQGLNALYELMGPGAADILRTGDSVEDKNLLTKFQERIAAKAELAADEMNGDHRILTIGSEETPFAIPLMRKNGRWYWDVKEGKAEVRRRVIGANELDAMQVCRGYVEAQQLYASNDWQGKGAPQYAGKIVSSPGKKDGLYWPGTDSPISGNVARAIAEGYTAPGDSSKGYHGYRYKVLLEQGPDAKGGAQAYVAHGLMIGGFALVAWPVEYGVSGIMTFIVNQDGVVYEKDLGPQTSMLARAMTKFNPDKSWTVSPDDTN